MTQTQIIKNRIEKYGFVENLWSIKNNIWRLGARVNELRNDGMKIDTIFKNKKGERNTKYLLVK